MPDTPANSYWEYLALDEILNAQRPLTGAHDEPLFIMIHQTFEVWFKLLIFELRATIAQLRVPDVTKAIHYLHRVTKILALTARGFEIMDTMTPEAFREFRDSLVPASGTQSFQFRELEILAGVRKVRDANGTEKYYWEETPDAGMTLRLFFEKYGERLRDLEKEAALSGTLRSQVSGFLLHATNASTLENAAVMAEGDARMLIDEVKKFDETFILWRGAHVQATAHAIADSPGTVLNEQGQLPTTACVGYLQSTIESHKRLLFPEFHV